MTRKAEQKQETHEAILASAAGLLRKQGIRASSVQDVMKGAGLTVGGFYSHFDSKEHLFAATIRNAGRIMRDWCSAALGATPRERAASVVRQYLSRAHRDHPEAGCILPSTAPEVAREGEPYREALEEQLRGFITSFNQILGKGAENRETSVALVALMYGALSLSRAVEGTPLSNELLKSARAAAEQLLEE
ncbi:MAG TPA: TetR/AcrR family transcriptional regulator [Thermoanaerobaculia bacterium]|nr:TetR/AcrR family transcriptional regulator [Thermoanaerobaculia bacterium]